MRTAACTCIVEYVQSPRPNVLYQQTVLPDPTCPNVLHRGV